MTGAGEQLVCGDKSVLLFNVQAKNLAGRPRPLPLVYFQLIVLRDITNSFKIWRSLSQSIVKSPTRSPRYDRDVVYFRPVESARSRNETRAVSVSSREIPARREVLDIVPGR